MLSPCFHNSHIIAVLRLHLPTYVRRRAFEAGDHGIFACQSHLDLIFSGELAMASPDITIIGNVCHEWDYQARECREAIRVSRVEGTSGFHFLTKLAVDADGAPKAYHPDDRVPLENRAKALDWLANVNVNDLKGVQGQQGATGPAPGFLISATALSNVAFPENDTRHWVDAATIPYVVLTGGSFPLPQGMRLKTGCLVYVVDTKTGGTSGAIYGDIGRAVGEGSVALALRLGLQPFSVRVPPKVTGFDGKRFFKIVFPGAFLPPPWDVSQLQTQADSLFQAWGGERLLRAIVPNIPPLQPPMSIGQPSIAFKTFPELRRPDFEPRRQRGLDLSKEQLLQL